MLDKPRGCEPQADSIVVPTGVCRDGGVGVGVGVGVRCVGMGV